MNLSKSGRAWAWCSASYRRVSSSSLTSVISAGSSLGAFSYLHSTALYCRMAGTATELYDIMRESASSPMVVRAL